MTTGGRKLKEPIVTGRGTNNDYRQDNGNPLNAEDTYTMAMLYRYQNVPVEKIARKFSIETVEARTTNGNNLGRGCRG